MKVITNTTFYYLQEVFVKKIKYVGSKRFSPLIILYIITTSQVNLFFLF